MTASLSLPEGKTDVDAIVETIIYLYTESRRLTKEMAGSYGLTGPQLTILKLLESFPDLSLSTLSERIRAQNSTVTGIVDRMEREGLVRRERSRSDRRVVLLRLSEKGGRLAREIQVEPMEIFRQALSEMSTNDLQDLLRILMKLQRGVLQRVSRSGGKQEAVRSDPQPPEQITTRTPGTLENRMLSESGDRGVSRKTRRSREGLE
ncbi:MarR family winged helix-turn-helix transcriptional regulator [Chondromyces apiculatus]|uniref:Transcriptional regulator, MarR family n=1 Tax=Chondromyces apiculatus DSM 436 TaxID=1192034 RepID=A0A017SX92_9BACT|nr:MarR family transcriptional regulator [Chondromyces apiculatus]EYF01543.1 transcriptional regulator, MarR family [Chondromyces apiculatus DSM 436]